MASLDRNSSGFASVIKPTHYRTREAQGLRRQRKASRKRMLREGMSLCRSGVGWCHCRAGEPVQIVEHAGDQLMAAPILGAQGFGEKRDQIARLLGR